MDRSPTFHQSVVNSGSRQSRIPVKDSQRKSRFSRSSSNAIRRVPSSSHLAVPQNYRNVRSKSCVNLQDLCATPLTSCSSSSIRTPLSSGSKYSVINTEFLTSQFSRVKKYFRNKDPTIQTLKPLTMAVYVQTMKILWNEIDPRIEIDPKKIDAIGEYLKLFKFPSQIKMSVLKAPTVPHNFQYILSIWVWLLDEIEAIHKILDAEQSNKHRIGFKFFMGRFKDMSDKNGGSEKITETFRQSCKEYLYKENKLRMQSYEECQQIEKKVRRDLQEATEKNVTLKTRLNEIQAKNREIELRNTVAINERDRLERDEEVLQNKYLNSLEEEKQLKKALNDQPCSLEEWKKIVEEHTLLSFELELKSKQENENKEQSSQIDMELMDVKCKIINVIENINSTIIRHLKYLPKMQEFLIPQKGHLQENMSQIIINFKEKLGELQNLKIPEQERLNNAMKELNATKAELAEQLESLKKSVEEQILINQELEQTKNEKANNHSKQIKEMQKHLEDKQKRKVDCLRRVEDLQDNLIALEGNIETLIKKEEKLNNHRNECQEQAFAFLNEVLEKLAKDALEVVRAVSDGHGQLDEVVKNTSKCLDVCIKLLEEQDDG